MNKTRLAVAVTAASVVLLSGCAATVPEGGTDDGRVRVVASTNVYGSLAAEIGGDRVEVTSLIDSAEKDPHSYEATARDRLAVDQADLVIENGGGYDAFLEELREGSDAVVITAVEFSSEDSGDGEGDPHAEEAPDVHEGDHEGHHHIEGVNEHVWFDVHTMSAVVRQIAADLVELDPAGEAEVRAASERLLADLADIEADIDALHERVEGTPVLITEPLPGLLAAEAGLDDVTPEGFASSVEEGNDVAPATLLDALDLVEGGQVRAVLANAQTGGAETDRVEDAAAEAGVPVIAFTELLAPEQSYAEWMRAAISDLAAALAE